MHAKRLTVTDHGLAMRVYCLHYSVLPRRKGKILSQNFVLITDTIAEINQSQSCYKWFETRVNLLVKVGKRYIVAFSRVLRKLYNILSRAKRLV